jgi:hypothetical protein
VSLKTLIPVFLLLPLKSRVATQNAINTLCYCISASFYTNNTRWFKYDRDYLCVNKSQFVPVIFEPPCILLVGPEWRSRYIDMLPVGCFGVRSPTRVRAFFFF